MSVSGTASGIFSIK